MLIDPKILVGAGAVFRKLIKGQTIYFEGDMPKYYFQIISGTVSTVNTRENAHDFIQGIFRDGQAFGIPAALLGEPYPASAIATSDVVLVRLGREAFISMLKENPKAHFAVTMAVSRLLYQKSFMSKGIACRGPEERIITLLDILKKESGCASGLKYRLNISRQQIADMVGLRVETVIRSIKKLEATGHLTISHGKVSY